MIFYQSNKTNQNTRIQLLVEPAGRLGRVHYSDFLTLLIKYADQVFVLTFQQCTPRCWIGHQLSRVTSNKLVWLEMFPCK
jgi:hypothetical protein